MSKVDDGNYIKYVISTCERLYGLQKRLQMTKILSLQIPELTKALYKCRPCP
jgi:hypothetical protein